MPKKKIAENTVFFNFNKGFVDKLYILLPLFLFVFQFVFTLNSMGQLRNEEIIESIRGVWWFQNRLVSDGGYANIGWYSLLLPFYTFFGFTVHMAKFAKLFVELVSFFALAAVLKKYLGVRFAWLPLSLVVLSPTFLFLNTLQISHGIEVNYFLISLFLIDFLNYKNPGKAFLVQGLAWGTAMFAWMSYPSFIYYLPILGVFYLYKLKKNRQDNLKNVLVSILAFLLPLIAGFLYIENRHLLVYDRSPQRGLFRSNGGFEVNGEIFRTNLNILKNDLFVTYDSYYYENPKVEFSDLYPIPVVLGVILLAGYIFVKDKKYRLLIGVIFSFLIIYTVLLNMIGPMGLGGVRRATSLLLLFYGLLAVVLYCFINNPKNKNLKIVTVGVGIVLLAHHLLVYPANLAHLNIPTPYRDRHWFAFETTPQKSLDLFVTAVQKEDLMLKCSDEKGQVVSCNGYNLIEAGVKGSCSWNKLYCHKIYGYDIKLDKFVLLDFDFYEGNNWDR